MARQKIGILTKLLLDAYKQEMKQRTWDMWIVDYLVSHFDENQHVIPFDDYFDNYTSQTRIKDTPSQEEYDNIINRAQKAKERHQKAIRKR